MKMLWLSKYELNEEQLKPFGNITIDWYNKQIKSIDEIEERIKDADIICANLPLNLLIDLIAITRKKPVLIAKNKKDTKKGEFNFEKWQKINSIKINKVDYFEEEIKEVNNKYKTLDFSKFKLDKNLCIRYLESDCKDVIDKENLKILILWTLSEKQNYEYLYKIIKNGNIPADLKALISCYVTENSDYKLMKLLSEKYAINFFFGNNVPLALLTIKLVEKNKGNLTLKDDYKKFMHLINRIKNSDELMNTIRNMVNEETLVKCEKLIYKSTKGDNNE